MPARLFVLTFVLASAATALAQPSAECPTSDCLPALQGTSPLHAQMWRDAAAIHQIKIAFVDAVQRFVRAQAGTFGDEGDELRLSVAAMRAALGTWDQAIQQFQTKAPRDAESHLAMATVWLDRHRLDAALASLDAAEQRDGSRIEIYTMRALALATLQRTDNAVRALQRASAIDPRDPRLSYTLAQQLIQLKRSNDAAQALRGAQRALAAASGQAMRFERVNLLRQSSDTAPIFAQARYADGFAALDSGDYTTAVAMLETAITGDPLVTSTADSRSRIDAAASAIRSGQIDASLAQLQAAAVASPGDSEPHRLLGLVYWIDEQGGKSIEHLRRAIQLAPADDRARVLLADVLASDRRLAEAERELTQARAAGLRSGQIIFRLEQLAQRQALLPQAAQAFLDSEPFGPVVGRDRFYQLWGSLLVNQADFDGAVVAYAKRIDVNPNNAEAHRSLGDIYFLQGRNDEALAEFSVAIWLDPKDAKAHAAAGQVYARQTKYAEAAVALQRALALDASLREARYALGTVLMRSGKPAEGRRELDLFARQQAEAEAAGQRESTLDALRRQASKDMLAGNATAAIARFTEAAALEPQSARSHRDLGLALLRAKRLLEAVEQLKAAQMIEQTADGYAYLVDALTASGDRVEAEHQRGLYRQHIVRGKIARIREIGVR